MKKSPSLMIEQKRLAALKLNLFIIVCFLTLFLLGLTMVANAQCTAGQSSRIFEAAGPTIQEWIVPNGVTELTIITEGAGGGNSDNAVGGSGASASSTFMVTPGDTLEIVVGISGEEGFGVGGGGGGGSGVQSNNPSHLLIVAGGGSGAANSTPGIDGNDGPNGINGGGN